MPQWIAELEVGQVVAFAIFAGGTIAAIWKLVSTARPWAKKLRLFLEDWNGEPARIDPSTGEVIEPAKPSAPALFERMRHQVENSHTTNLRDDIDKLTELVQQLTTSQARMNARLTQHVEIAKKSDERLAAVETELKKEG